MNIVVIGAGYVGLVTGVSLAKMSGHRVTFVERSPERLQAIKAGKAPISEPGLDNAFASVRDRIAAVATLDKIEGQPDLALIAVATPIGEDGESDLSQLREVAGALTTWTDVDICVRSTLPPGTSVRLPGLFGRPDGRRLSTNPEFLRQGSAMNDYEHPSRIVIGKFPETEERHLSVVRSALGGIDAPLLEVSVQAAELIKNVANGFLALKLSFVNEVASLSEEYDVDVAEVLNGIALDPRIGSTYMHPGLGFGGSCLPKELQVLAAAGRRQGLGMHIARAASLVNAEQQDRFARRILKELGEGQRTVALLGLSFKAGTDDLRGSPAITVARRLVSAGHRVCAHDPVVSRDRAEAAVPGMAVAGSIDDALRAADAVVVATEWPEYGLLDWQAVAGHMAGRLVFDGRNMLNGDSLAAAGFNYRAVGRPSPEASHSDRTAALEATRS